MPKTATASPNLRPALTKREVAALLKCHPKTVEKLVAARRLTPVAIGNRWRFRVEDVERFMAGK